MRQNKSENELTHLIFTYKGKTYSRFKDWSFDKCEQVLERIGATYWEISI